MTVNTSQPTPKWSLSAKIVVGLTFIAIGAGLLIRFQSMIGPLLMVFIVAYLVYPIGSFLQKRIKIPWRVAITIMYLVLVLVILGLLTWGGLTLADQIQSLVAFLQKTIKEIPAFLDSLTERVIQIGPFSFSLSTDLLNNLADQALGSISPLLGQAGSLVGKLASGAASILGWVFFIIMVSYFLILETGGAPERLINLRIPGYETDLRRLSSELGRIWNAFLRGQLLIITITVLLYTVLLGGLGVNFYFGLALLAGLARFIPYVGPAVAWTTYGLVCLFQPSNYFGLQPLTYAIIVVAVALVVDNIFDAIATPRIMATALRVHPAAVLVAAIIGANLLGFVGVVLASPVLATLKLFSEYAFRKLFDQDPWQFIEPHPAPPPSRWSIWLSKAWSFISERIKLPFKTNQTIVEKKEHKKNDQ